MPVIEPMPSPPATSPPATSPLATSPPATSPSDASPSASSPTAGQGALRTAPTVYVEWHTTAEIEGILITADRIEEKRTMDGDEVLRVEITARAGARSQQLSFTGELREPQLFAGRWIQLRGGSRAAAGFAVVRASSE